MNNLEDKIAGVIGATDAALPEKPDPAPCSCGELIEPFVCFDRWMLPPACSECVEAAERKRREQEEEVRRAYVRRRRLKNSGLSGADIDITERLSEHHHPHLAAMVEAVADVELVPYDQEHGAYLWSYSTGTGKTTQLLLTVRAAIESGMSARYTTEEALLDSLRPNDDGSPHKTLDDWDEYDLLAIDELGTCLERRDPSWSSGKLYQLLDRRYRARRPILFAANKPLRCFGGRAKLDKNQAWAAKAGEHFGRRFTDRIIEMAGLSAHYQSDNPLIFKLTTNWREKWRNDR